MPRRRRDVTLVDISKTGARAVAEASLPPGPIHLQIGSEATGLKLWGELLSCERHDRQRGLFVLHIRFVEQAVAAQAAAEQEAG